MAPWHLSATLPHCARVVARTIPNDALGVANGAPELRNGGGQGRSQMMAWRLPKVVPNVALVIAVGAREYRHGCGKWRAPE